jgi:hypothetical protein
MKLTMEIIGLRTTRDNVLVEAQGTTETQAEWRPMLRWEFAVPEHIGKRYRIGQRLNVVVTT